MMIKSDDSGRIGPVRFKWKLKAIVRVCKPFGRTFEVCVPTELTQSKTPAHPNCCSTTYIKLITAQLSKFNSVPFGPDSESRQRQGTSKSTNTKSRLVAMTRAQI